MKSLRFLFALTLVISTPICFAASTQFLPPGRIQKFLPIPAPAKRNQASVPEARKQPMVPEARNQSKMPATRNPQIVPVVRNRPASQPPGTPTQSRRAQDDQAFFDQKVKSERLLLQNLNLKTVAPGIVISSPVQSQPDYFFHWVRDAAIAFVQFQYIYQMDPNSTSSRPQMQNWMLAHVDLNLHLQVLARASKALMGEPKFNPDASAFLGAWPRPQNDSPALRAISFMSFLNLIMKENSDNRDSLIKKLYDPVPGGLSIIKTDLDYIAHHWADPSFDLWEESYGNHFFTLVVSRKALALGAMLARTMGDTQSATIYQQESMRIVQALQTFWNPSGNYILATLNGRGQVKPYNIDSAILMASLYGDMGDGFIAPYDDHILATLEVLKEIFQKEYPINQNSNFGIAMGRYSGDRFDGVNTNGIGNPWFITTQTTAEIYYRAAQHALQTKQIQITTVNLRFYNQLMNSQMSPGQIFTPKDQIFLKITEQLLNEGDRHLERTIIHRGADGSLSQQFNRASGVMQGAANLTWSHASFLSAIAWREYIRGLL